MNANADQIGRLLMSNLRDVSLELSDGLCNSRFSSPGHKAMQRQINEFTPEQKEILRAFVAYCVDGGINDFLASLDKESDIGFSVRGEVLHSLRDRLFGTDGWRARYSTYDSEGGSKQSAA
jgi:hypothetical protein